MRRNLSLLPPLLLAGQALSYFIITTPGPGTQWANDATNVVRWTKGLKDDILAFDFEMARMGSDGLVFVARNVPADKNDLTALNVEIHDLPAGDDYFLLFLNSTHGGVHAVSDRFTILASGQTPNTTAETDGAVPTVTVSGSPNPTVAWATTMAGYSGALPRWDMGGWGKMVMTVSVGVVVGAGAVFW